DLLVEHVSERPSAPDIAAAGTPQDIETFDGTIDIDAAAHSAARADGIEVQEEVVLEPRAMEVEGLAHTQYESDMFAPPAHAADAAAGRRAPAGASPSAFPGRHGERENG